MSYRDYRTPEQREDYVDPERDTKWENDFNLIIDMMALAVDLKFSGYDKLNDALDEAHTELERTRPR
ncbi:MAG TPA: hypothetical protein VJA46_12140 [Acidimicrobiia bacterium]|nr:hypothetical protein [Acidimicrobiia bacterium]